MQAIQSEAFRNVGRWACRDRDHASPGLVGTHVEPAAQRNALSTSLLLQLESGVQQSEQRGATVIVLSAAGPVFCAGVDIKERRRPDYSQGTSAPFVQALLSTSAYLVARVEAPVLGAGLALLAVCPTVIATSDVWAALPESRRGNFPVAVAPTSNI